MLMWLRCGYDFGVPCGVAERPRCGTYRCRGSRVVAGAAYIPEAKGPYRTNFGNRFERMKLRVYQAGLRGRDYWKASWKLLSLLQEADQLPKRHPMVWVAQELAVKRRTGFGYRIVFSRYDGLHWVRLP